MLRDHLTIMNSSVMTILPHVMLAYLKSMSILLAVRRPAVASTAALSAPSYIHVTLLIGRTCPLTYTSAFAKPLKVPRLHLALPLPLPHLISFSWF